MLKKRILSIFSQSRYNDAHPDIGYALTYYSAPVDHVFTDQYELCRFFTSYVIFVEQKDEID